MSTLDRTQRKPRCGFSVSIDCEIPPISRPDVRQGSMLLAILSVSTQFDLSSFDPAILGVLAALSVPLAYMLTAVVMRFAVVRVPAVVSCAAAAGAYGAHQDVPQALAACAFLLVIVVHEGLHRLSAVNKEVQA